MPNIHCPMIHGGLQIDLKKSQLPIVNNCCLRNDGELTREKNVWLSKSLQPLRELNKKNQWDQQCWTCQGNELAGMTSFRTGMLEKFGERIDLTGPTRLDLMFDIGCNLACRSCGPDNSTYWQRHLKENNIGFDSVTGESKADEMIEILKHIDLSNLEMVVFCGGETLLGQGYWRVAEALTELAPVEQITLCFQTNGTQAISQRNYDIIRRFQLVKLHISIDGVGSRFEYLRWPACWQQVVDNINELRASAPDNVMFLIEETISIFNLYYRDELKNWLQTNYNANRFGDEINHTAHMAYGKFSLDHVTNEYVAALRNSNHVKLVNPAWQENATAIGIMIDKIQRFDKIRNQNWKEVFPEVAEFYKRFDPSLG